MSKDNEKRYMELSSKIFEMGVALSKEGESKDDYNITSVGNIMTLVSGLLYDIEDMELFGELCSMFSAKKLIDNQMEMGSFSDMGDDELMRMITRLRKEAEDDDFNNDDEDEDDD